MHNESRALSWLRSTEIAAREAVTTNMKVARAEHVHSDQRRVGKIALQFEGDQMMLDHSGPFVDLSAWPHAYICRAHFTFPMSRRLDRNCRDRSTQWAAVAVHQNVAPPDMIGAAHQIVGLHSFDQPCRAVIADPQLALEP